MVLTVVANYLYLLWRILSCIRLVNASPADVCLERMVWLAEEEYWIRKGAQMRAYEIGLAESRCGFLQQILHSNNGKICATVNPQRRPQSIGIGAVIALFCLQAICVAHPAG